MSEKRDTQNPPGTAGESEPCTPGSSAGPNILLLVIDCLRADHAYDPGISSSPVLASLVSGGFSFTNAIATSSRTTLSFAAILSGLDPPANGVRDMTGHKPSPGITLLPEALRRAGYNTYAEVCGPLCPEVGLDRGFCEYAFRDFGETVHTTWGDSLLEKIARRFHTPWFLLLNVWSLHTPRWILPTCRGRDCGATVYARALSSLDRYLQRLLGVLPPDTAIVLTGDHGEEISTGWLDGLRRRLATGFLKSKMFFSLQKRGLIRRRLSVLRRGHTDGHSYGIYDHLIKVPMLIHHPGRISPGVSETQVRHVDICPTVLEMAGAQAPPGLTGASLLDVVRGQTAHRDAYCEAGSFARRRKARVGGLRVENRFKYICGLFGADEAPELYDLQEDPGETRNLAGERPEIMARMREKMADVQERSAPQQAMSEDEKNAVRDRLKLLGYL